MNHAAAAAEESSRSEFLTSLVAELKASRVELPSWSKVTERARTALARAEIDNDELARLMGAEAGLAVRVLTVANSALFTRGGRPLSDLKVAILRIGHDNLRSTVYAYALAQLRQAPRLQHLRAALQQLWQESTTVAALTRLLAIRTGAADADEALLAGLLHNIGKIYILARLDDAAAVALDEHGRTALLLGWHARVGALVAANWQLADGLCAAIRDQEVLGAADSGQNSLGAVLAAAVVGANAAGSPAESAALLAGYTRFGLDAAGWLALLEQAGAESAGLRASFGD
jgi:HD-like signal output (HDOD) protein